MAVSVNNALWQHRTDQTEKCVQSFMAVSVNNALWQYRTDQTEECVYIALLQYLSTMLYSNIGLTKLRNVCIELYGCICHQCFMAT